MWRSLAHALGVGGVGRVWNVLVSMGLFSANGRLPLASLLGEVPTLRFIRFFLLESCMFLNPESRHTSLDP